MKKLLGLIILLLPGLFSVAQLKSPEEFLGYKLGARYSPHFQVVNYFRHVAEAVPSMVKLEQYGTTHEGRPLYLSYIGSSGNISRLEDIRNNNLALAGMSKGSASTTAPAIVWLSYNVHGNETSSSEAAMRTLFELVNPSNSDSKKWLENTIVIIDPCLNPDGRDRYVNWYNSVVGNQPDPNIFSREHLEPWPGGRFNHYYFDLNRDWAWQSQIESRQRMVKYNQWLPHVHVDFHEQGHNEPYYFAPAAEPFHDVITPWQREFQTMIGKNHAGYFDREGWLYFTKERFDLFYPSYGDTYPTYKGAIGMTYEQGGGGRGGSAVIIEDGDTLTLEDRVDHHYTTGISTIEVVSENAKRVVEEFKNYYDKAINAPTGEFKSYVVKYEEGDRITRLTELLDRNNIKWSYTRGGNISGLNYITGKNETFRSGGRDILVNANQPNSNLVRVLFEREPRLSDSVTYDITAWSIPYMFGLTTWGSKSYLPAGEGPVPIADERTSPKNIYAYVVDWNGVASAKFLAQILRQGVKIRFSESSFEVDGKQFGKGSVIVPKAGNSKHAEQLKEIVRLAAIEAKVGVTPISTGFVEKGFDLGSDRVRVLRSPRIGLLAGDEVSPLAMGETWHFFENELKYPVHVIRVEDLQPAVFKNLDIVIMPDGNYSSLNDKPFNEALKSWVNSGGKIIAMENAAVQLAKADYGFQLKTKEDKKSAGDDKKKVDYSLLKSYDQRERDMVTSFNPGSIYSVEMDNSHPLAYGYNNVYYTLKMDDHIYEFIPDKGWNVGVLKQNNHVSGFAGVKAKERLQDGLLFGEAVLGRGSVIILADNPLFRNFWESGKLLFCNAVFMTGQ